MLAYQSAYRQHHSTETAVLKIISDVYDAADTSMVTVLMMLDLSAAFDTVDHQILILRLNRSLGIGRTALSWLKSFLTDSTQTVTLAGKQSMPTNIHYDVPQGSILGSLHYNLCTADIMRIAASFGIHVYCYMQMTFNYMSLFMLMIPLLLLFAC